MTRHVHLAVALLAACASLPLAAHAEHRHEPPSSAQPAARQAGNSAWSQAPQIVAAMPGGERGQARFKLRNIEAAQLEVLGPGAVLQPRLFPVADGSVSVTPSDAGQGNYHWLIARQSTPNEERVASTAWYVSNPGPAPTAMLAAPHPGLLIVPRLPREHAGYREGERWPFSVRFNGQPLPGAVLKLETEFGTISRAVADAQGNAELLFPRDFDPARIGTAQHGGMRANAKFVVSSAWQQGDKHYLSAFNGAYGPDPTRSRNLAAGAAFGLLGMILAAPLLRRPSGKKENNRHA
jgi:hypothetical protein